MKQINKASGKAAQINANQPQKAVTSKQPSFWRQKIAYAGESVAASLYEKQGCQILERNWRAGHRAEIDLICRDVSGLLIFVEVKTRCKEPGEYGFINYGFESVNGIKQRKIQHGVACYLAHKGLAEASCRIDVLVVEYDSSKISNGQLPEPVVTQVTEAF